MYDFTALPMNSHDVPCIVNELSNVQPMLFKTSSMHFLTNPFHRVPAHKFDANTCSKEWRRSLYMSNDLQVLLATLLRFPRTPLASLMMWDLLPLVADARCIFDHRGTMEGKENGVPEPGAHPSGQGTREPRGPGAKTIS